MPIIYLRQSTLFLVLFLLIPTLGLAAINPEFPGRNTYPYVKYINLNNLYWKIEAVTLVDVRSRYEFQTLRIKGAINIPLASRDFVKAMRTLRKKTNQPIIVYCNGKTCLKSYKAAAKCHTAHIENVIAYDAGIMDWAKSYPDLTVLLGKPLTNPNQIISKSYYKKHTISPAKFGTLIYDGKAIALDIRDGFQREGLAIFSGVEIRVSLDNKQRMDKYIALARKNKLPLIIFDAAGKQTRWLQYYLERQKLKDYYFMAGGIRAYYDSLTTSSN